MAMSRTDLSEQQWPQLEHICRSIHGHAYVEPTYIHLGLRTAVLSCKTKSRSRRLNAGDEEVPRHAAAARGKGVQPAAQHIAPGPSRVDGLLGGEPRIAERPSVQKPAYGLADTWGAWPRRPGQRAGIVVESSEARTAGASRSRQRVQRGRVSTMPARSVGRPPFGARASFRSPNRRPDVQSGIKAVVLLPRERLRLACSLPGEQAIEQRSGAIRVIDITER